MTLATILHAMFMTVYTLSLIVVSVFGFHRWMLLMIFYRNRRKSPSQTPDIKTLPMVTVQLPIFNEKQVVRRVIDHACGLDWPRERLQIQVLDDSDDGETSDIAKERVSLWSARGLNIEYVTRPDRRGYKAGNLANGLKSATGEFLMIFDSDFAPRPDILRKCMPHFNDPKVCVVQSRWEHLNRSENLLTRGQAVLLDGNFMIEQLARNLSGRFVTFKGSGGAWRKSAIIDAGGWQTDTLTEDMDLSYRAQLKGWKIVYLPELTSPAELPGDMNSFKSQQNRWTKGGVQTAIKLLPRIWLSDSSLKIKIEATFHLCSFSIHLFIVVLMLMLYPAMVVQSVPVESGTVWRTAFELSVFGLATLSAGAFYLCGQGVLFGSWFKTLLYLPFLMALGVGISISNAKAALEALMGHKSEFICTPKVGDAAGTAAGRRMRRKGRASRLITLLELAMALYLGMCAYSAFSNPAYAMGGGFLTQFAIGFLYVAFGGLRGLLSPVAKDPKPQSGNLQVNSQIL